MQLLLFTTEPTMFV